MTTTEELGRPTQLYLGGKRGDLTVAAGGGKRTTVSWTQRGETFSVAYQENVLRTKRYLDMETRVSREGALDKALNTVREILVANGFDQQPGNLLVSMSSGYDT